MANLDFGLVVQTLRNFKYLFICFFVCTNTLYAEFYVNEYVKSLVLKSNNATFQKRFDKLVLLLNGLEQQKEKNKLESVNNFFNQTEYLIDLINWGVDDYWANTTEFLYKDRADCEDYVFAKYFALKKLGVDTKKLKSFYVKSLKYNTAHMVLAYYDGVSVEPLILDNYNFLILPASKRVDLQPIKLFDTEQLLIAKYKQIGLLAPNNNEEAFIWLEVIQGIRSQK